MHGEPSTTEPAWQEWKEKCAAELCAPENAAMLRRFGRRRFSSLLKKLIRDRQLVSADEVHGWHLLETYSQASSTRAGKRYKEWLFTRADLQSGTWVGSVESGATLLMREAVRHYVRREHAPAFMVSLQKNIGTESAATLEDLLPDPGDPLDEVAIREWHLIADALAGDLIASMSLAEKKAVAARANGFALSDPEIVAGAGCSRAHLYQAHRDAIEKIGFALKRKHPDESASTLLAAARLVLECLAEKINRPVFEENTTRNSFSFV